MIEVRVLGGLAARIDREDVALPADARARELLAWLALHPGRHPRAARALAAGLPDARLLALDGDVHPPWLGDPEPVLVALLAFLRSGRNDAPNLDSGRISSEKVLCAATAA